MTVTASGKGKNAGVAAKLDPLSPSGKDCSGSLV
jgi:hypothetical protein